MPSDQVAQPWALRSALISVSDLERSVAFYQEVGALHVMAREDAVVVLGEESTASIVLILREARSRHQVRHGQQSLGLRVITFNVRSTAELDRTEAVLRSHDLLTERRPMLEGAVEFVRGRDPDNLPLVFVCYAEDTIGTDYYRTLVNMYYSLDA
jgi:catechol 2,3-dioxygenase-like lactoylglutathione lyase family enzyme